MVAGSKNVIEKIRVNRKRLGGNLRKPGVIAHSCLISLDNINNFIDKAHESAEYLA
jgi:threonine aldolase